MALSQSEKERIIDQLDKVNDFERVIILATAEALGNWLKVAIYYIYQKIKAVLMTLWEWLITIF